MASPIFKLAEQPTADIVRAIRSGISVSSIDGVAAKLQMSKREVARKLRLNPKILRCKPGAMFTAEPTEKIIRLARVMNLVRKLFTNDDAVADWLRRPAPALKGTAPIDMLDTDVGGREVEALILGIAHGNVI